MLAEEGNKVVHLSQWDTLLAQDVVGGRQVEEEVGESIASDVGMASNLSILARSQSHRNGLANPLVDDLLVGLCQNGLDLVNALEEIVKGLEVVLELLRLGARGTGSSLLGDVAHEVNLEAQGQHVLVDTRIGKAGSVGSRLSLLEDGLERLKDILGSADRGVVESERHCGWNMVVWRSFDGLVW